MCGAAVDVGYRGSFFSLTAEPRGDSTTTWNVVSEAKVGMAARSMTAILLPRSMRVLEEPTQLVGVAHDVDRANAAVGDVERVGAVGQKRGDRVFVTYEGRNTNGRRFRNTEILTIRDQHIVDVEVYFGWSLPHKAPQGGFVHDAGLQ